MAQLFFTTILCSLLHSIAFLSLAVEAVGHDILCPDQELVIGQTLVSPNQVFEMGFFFPGKSMYRFLGIWYKSTPDVVVWVANRNNPISASQAPVFKISRNRSLVIRSGKSIIWSVNSSMVASNPVLQLLDSGNLVLVDNISTTYVWQSFDHPTDTLLPGMKIVDDVDGGVERYLTSWRNPDDPSPGDFVFKIQNHGLADLVVLRGERKRYRVGQWNGMYFCGGVRFPNPMFNPDLVFIGERLISIRDPYQSSLQVRTSLDITAGTVLRHTLNLRKDKWNLAITFPQDSCDEYASCGPNGMCRSDRPIRCQCLKGFAPKFPKDWDLQDWSRGCDRITPLNCEGGDGFAEVRGVKYPDMLRFWLNTSMSLEECRDKCLKNCSCTAYANPFITNGGSGCLMWFDELMDIKGLSAADSKQNLYIRVPLSEIEFSAGLGEEEKKKPMKLMLVSVVSGILVSAIINGGLFFMARRKRRAEKRNEDDLELPVIKMATLVQATNNFSKENMIGVGGFGPVYKGKMLSGEEIAVKRLSKSSRQGLEEFRNEVMAWILWKENKILELMDECLNDTFTESQVKRCMQVGLLCVQKFAEDRPTMASVVSMLGTDGAFLPEPKEPGFFNERSRSSSYEQSSSSPSLKSENEITITDLEAR